MANLLVIVEVIGERARPVSLEALGQARRVGTQLGATVYAVVPLAQPPRGSGADELISTLGRHGADKVMLVTDEALSAGAGDMRWGTYGGALAAVGELLPPMLVLLGATAGGREVAARLAARLGAAFLGDAWVGMDDAGIHLRDASGARLDGDLEFPVVATVPPGRYDVASGDDDAEVEIVATSGGKPDFELLDEEPAPAALIVCGPGEDERAAAEALAAALGGRVMAADPEPPAALAVSLGPSLAAVAAEVRVALGNAAGANYSVDGEPGPLARALAAALQRSS